MAQQTPPIWIDNLRVDSTAMLMAYQSTVTPRSPWYGRLPLEVHRMIDHHGTRTVCPPSVLPRPCRTPGCFRCQVGQGGYAFRRFHPSWLRLCLQRKRGNVTWTPGETAAVAAQRDAQFYGSQAAHQAQTRERMRQMEAGLAAVGGDMGQYIRNLVPQARDRDDDSDDQQP